MKLPALGLVLLALVPSALGAQTVEKPIRLGSIEIAGGHAAPFAADVDGDGTKDLIVSEGSAECGLRVWQSSKDVRYDMDEWYWLRNSDNDILKNGDIGSGCV
ncbi:MAG: hypothetical protein IT462_14350 [Planctomycetes bacterium]|nr:hypothetical protein [Planctomycetota bacterium]